MAEDSGLMRPVEFYILLALGRGEMHGYGIIRETERQSGGQVRLDPGTLYRAIQRLARSGLLEEAQRVPAEDLGQRRRRYYRITEAGRTAAAREARRMALLVRSAADVHLIENPREL